MPRTPRNARQVHDFAAGFVLRKHLSDLCLHAVEHTPDVNGHHLIKILLCLIDKPGEFAADAGVVDANIQPAKGLGRVPDGGFDLSRVGDIAGYKLGGSARLFNERHGFAATGFVHFRNHHLRSGLRKGQGCSPPNT